MKRLPPLLSYYGTKYNTAPHYPRPRYRKIIEPFAGGASYSLYYPDRDVLLVDKYETLIAVWQFLIASKPSEILAIPLLGEGQTVEDLPVCQEARWLVGWWVNNAVVSPCRGLSKWGREYSHLACFWGEKCRARIAAAVPHIKHWRAICADYESLDLSEPATWFVDPPYVDKGVHYKHGSGAIDFHSLGAWCQRLPGQAMVCENMGATWLPFEPFLRAESSTGKRAGHKSVEALWTNDGWRMPQQTNLII